MRKNDPMLTQLEYGFGVRRALYGTSEENLSRSFQFLYWPKCYYPDKRIDGCPPPTASKASQSKKIEELNSEDIQQLRDFAISHGKNVRQHTVRDKSKECTAWCLPYSVSFNVNSQDDGEIVETQTVFGDNPNSQRRRATAHYEVSFLGKELRFSEDTVDLLWFDNANTNDAFTFVESYRDNKNSPYTGLHHSLSRRHRTRPG